MRWRPASTKLRVFRKNLKPLFLAAAVAALLLGLERSRHLQWVDNLIAEQRMSFAQRPASGTIVYLAIDNKSLDRIGVWPWSRELYAQIVERLIQGGVASIAFDIDFSSASNPEADRALARALTAAGGAVILPAFIQTKSASAGDTRMGRNMPLPMFLDEAWLAAVNVSPDPDGVVRQSAYSLMLDDMDTPSLPALLTGRTGKTGTDFAINFAVDPESVPAFSVIDLLDGRIRTEELSGKSVVVGAHAVELGDRFVVPVHGAIPGSLLQILAAETLAQDIVPLLVDSRLLLLGVAALILFSNFSGRFVALRGKLLFLAAVAVALEFSGFLLLARYSVMLPTGGAHLALLASGAMFGLKELDLRGWLLRVARAATTNTQLVLEQIISDSSDVVLIVAEDGSIVEMSRYARRLFGSSGNGLLRLNQLAPTELSQEVQESLAALRAGQWQPRGAKEASFRLGPEERLFEYTVTPSRLTLVGKQPSSTTEEEAFVACITARDVTERRRHEASVEYLARFDQDTGAMRRSELLVRLEAAMAAWPNGGGACGVFAINLHRFGTVNATLGRAVGDMILSSVVRRLDSCDPRLSKVARLGGNTFAAFTVMGVDANEARELAEKLVTLINEPFEVDGTTARIGAKIGITLAHPPGRQTNTILGNAEAALDEARKLGGNAVEMFDAASFARQSHARTIERELWSALRNREFHVVYQPQVRLSDFCLVGAEALVRWNHPVLGQIPPVEFIGIAEANGFIEELGQWVLEKACTDAAWWPSDLTVAINVSPLQLARGDLIADVKIALQRSRLSPSRLHLEITESSFIAPSEDLFEKLNDIRALGVSLALDDFGTGFSSLSYLTRLPLDKIKIDRTFIQRVGAERVSQSILKSVRLLTEELGIKLVCEGIETKDELNFVRGIGCEEGQGYLFGRPQSESQFQRLARSTVEAS